MNHKIAISFSVFTLKKIPLTLKIKSYIKKALELQGVYFPCEVNVLITDDETIRAINSASRQIDRATDVLSFPMFQFQEGEIPGADKLHEYQDPATGLVPLGDMAISMDHVKSQAEEFGHSVERELGYLTVHSILHLLGYDHMDEGEMKARMRSREEAILTELGLQRN